MTEFHPGHDALHGFTVVVVSRGPKTVVGRWDAEQDGVILLNDACVHVEGERGLDRAGFFDELARTGPRPEIPRVAIARADVAYVRRLGDVLREIRGD